METLLKIRFELSDKGRREACLLGQPTMMDQFLIVPMTPELLALPGVAVPPDGNPTAYIYQIGLHDNKLVRLMLDARPTPEEAVAMLLGMTARYDEMTVVAAATQAKQQAEEKERAAAESAALATQQIAVAATLAKQQAEEREKAALAKAALERQQAEEREKAALARAVQEKRQVEAREKELALQELDRQKLLAILPAEDREDAEHIHDPKELQAHVMRRKAQHKQAEVAAKRTAWIMAHGSERLKLGDKAGFPMTDLYDAERLTIDRPGWARSYPTSPERLREPVCPSLEALRALTQARQQYGAGTTIRTTEDGSEMLTGEYLGAPTYLPVPRVMCECT